MSIVQMMQYYYMKIFFLMGKRSSPPVRVFNRRCWCLHHQRFQIRTGGDGCTSPTVLEPAVMAPLSPTT